MLLSMNRIHFTWSPYYLLTVTPSTKNMAIYMATRNVVWSIFGRRRIQNSFHVVTLPPPRPHHDQHQISSSQSWPSMSSSLNRGVFATRQINVAAAMPCQAEEPLSWLSSSSCFVLWVGKRGGWVGYPLPTLKSPFFQTLWHLRILILLLVLQVRGTLFSKAIKKLKQPFPAFCV